MKKKIVCTILGLLLAMSCVACGNSENMPGQDNSPASTHATVEETQAVKGKIETYEQAIESYVGTYYDKYGETFSLKNSGTQYVITDISFDTRVYGRCTAPSTKAFSDADTKIASDGTCFTYNEAVELVSYKVLFDLEDPTRIYFEFHDDEKEIDLASSFYRDPNVVENIHYYKDVYLKCNLDKGGRFEETYRLFTDGYALADGAYFHFTYDTDSGYVKEIEFVTTYNQLTSQDVIEDEVERLYKSRADDYHFDSVTLNDKVLTVKINISAVGAFESTICDKLLYFRQDIDGFVEAITNDYSAYYTIDAGDGYIFHPLFGYRAEWN